MRVGILGGTFDPVHDAHVYIATKAAEEMALDRVLFIPTGHPPHKLCPFAGREERLEMLRLAIGFDKRFEISDIEVHRSGTTYTIETLLALQESYGKNGENAEFFYIIGSDTLAVLDKWRRFGEIAELCEFVVLKRPGEDGTIGEDIERLSQYGAKITVLEIDAPDISSTDIRIRAVRGESLSSLVADEVGEYIQKKAIYRYALLRDEIDGWLKNNLSQKRYAHILGVEHMSVELAERHGADVMKASLAALLHDCAKEFPIEKLAEYARRDGSELDEFLLNNAGLLHSFAGAAFAKEKFGVEDEEMLSAVRKHTMGSKQMSLLDKIIFLADCIEPGRNDEWMDEARKLAQDDINAACVEAVVRTTASVMEYRYPLHPQNIETYNDLLTNMRRNANGEERKEPERQ